jgi:hypothetical protein
MLFDLLNCSIHNTSPEYLNCTFMDNGYESGYDFERIATIFALIISLAGVFLNPLCFFVIFSSNKTNNKFLHLLKYYCLNSFMISLNDSIHNFLFIFPSSKANYIIENWTYENNQYYGNEEFVYYKTKVFFPLWIVFYTLAGFLDICIAYQRLEIYIPKLTLFKKKSSGFTAFFCLLFAILINLPSIGIFSYESAIISLANNEIKVYTYKIKEFVSNLFFHSYLYFNSFIRDILSIVLKFTLNGFLIYWTLREKKEFQARISSHANSIKQKKGRNTTTLNNSKIIFVIASFSLVIHLQVYAIVLMVLLDKSDTEILNDFISILGLTNTFKHAMNILIFYKLNRKFKSELSKLFVFSNASQADNLIDSRHSSYRE